MKYIKEKLAGVHSMMPDIHEDERGHFFETFNIEEFNDVVADFNVMQENESLSKCKVLRGLHYQVPPFNQAKIVRVTKGIALDVIVDIRRDSPTFGEFMTFLLTDYDNIQLFVPRGFAHGFAALSKNVRFQYKVDNVYAPNYDAGIYYNDPDLKIDWEIQNPIVSNKDKELPRLQDVHHYDKARWDLNPNIL